jgi:hypothetical protein
VKAAGRRVPDEPVTRGRRCGEGYANPGDDPAKDRDGFVNSSRGGPAAAFHHMLLRMAGWLPDETVYRLRERLATNHFAHLAQALTFVALANRCPVAPGDVTLLRDTLSEADEDGGPLADLDVVEAPGAPCYAMSAVHPRRLVERPEQFPYSLDLTGAASGLDNRDSVDLAAVGAAAEAGSDAAVTGLWRSWRSPAIPTPWPPPRRLYLVLAETDDWDLLPALAARFQGALVGVGEVAPQVEVFAEPDVLPPYQSTALGWSALLWTAHPTPPVEVAELFDEVDEVGGPGFAETHPTLDDVECDRVLAYLDGGSPLLTTSARMDDMVAARRGHGVVPLNLRTDGRWIWTDAVAYFLRHYRLAPDPRLLEHVRDRRYHVPRVDAVARHRAMAALETMTFAEDR